jgi:hypothetical protein
MKFSRSFWVVCSVTFAGMVLLAPRSEGSYQAREGYSKVLVGKRHLVALPNATAPASISVLTGLDAEVLHEYDSFTLAYVVRPSVDIALDRGRAHGVSVADADHFDKIVVNRRTIDVRSGLARSLPNEHLDEPYDEGERGSWVIQFAGPIKPEWSESVRSYAVHLVQYLPYNAYIAVADTAAIRRVADLPYVQFADRMHTFMKPSIRVRAGTEVELWIHIAGNEEHVAETIELLSLLSKDGIKHSSWSATETRVQGKFDASSIDLVLHEPLVVAVVRRPTIRVSGEREAASLSNLDPTVSSGRRYKKWLADTCAGCGNLSSQNYYLGIADLGLDGGLHQRAPSGPPPGNANELGSSGLHRIDLDDDRIAYGSSFEVFCCAPYDPNNGSTPDSTSSLHDIHGHGTMDVV